LTVELNQKCSAGVLIISTYVKATEAKIKDMLFEKSRYVSRM
jgi:hypothetical protein